MKQPDTNKTLLKILADQTEFKKFLQVSDSQNLKRSQSVKNVRGQVDQNENKTKAKKQPQKTTTDIIKIEQLFNKRLCTAYQKKRDNNKTSTTTQLFTPRRPSPPTTINLNIKTPDKPIKRMHFKTNKQTILNMKIACGQSVAQTQTPLPQTHHSRAPASTNYYHPQIKLDIGGKFWNFNTSKEVKKFVFPQKIFQRRSASKIKQNQDKHQIISTGMYEDFSVQIEPIYKQ